MKHQLIPPTNTAGKIRTAKPLAAATTRAAVYRQQKVIAGAEAGYRNRRIVAEQAGLSSFRESSYYSTLDFSFTVHRVQPW